MKPYYPLPKDHTVYVAGGVVAFLYLLLIKVCLSVAAFVDNGVVEASGRGTIHYQYRRSYQMALQYKIRPGIEMLCAPCHSILKSVTHQNYTACLAIWIDNDTPKRP